jgi:ubiquinone/menaquinone biosynthesis C-methylase UbiE
VQSKLDDYKQQVADVYNQRSKTYGINDWHPHLAEQLVHTANLQLGWRVLDVATGTGLAAFAAARQVGSTGSVLGVDISEEMLNVARHQSQSVTNAPCEFRLADIESADFPRESFDAILCSSAIVWLADIPAALAQWNRWLAPGGVVAFHAFSERSFVTGWVLQQVAPRHGVSLASFHGLTGSPQRCTDLLKTAGFVDISVHSEDRSAFLSEKEAYKQYSQILTGPYPQSPTSGSPFGKLNDAQRSALQADYEKELAKLVTDKGIWNENITFYMVGKSLNMQTFAEHMISSK